MTTDLKVPMFQKSIGERLAEFHCMKIPLNRESNFVWENTEKYFFFITHHVQVVYNINIFFFLKNTE